MRLSLILSLQVVLLTCVNLFFQLIDQDNSQLNFKSLHADIFGIIMTGAYANTCAVAAITLKGQYLYPT